MRGKAVKRGAIPAMFQLNLTLLSVVVNKVQLPALIIVFKGVTQFNTRNGYLH